MTWRVAIFAVAITAAASSRANTRTQEQPALRVESATIGKDGRVHLRWTGQPDQIVPRDRGGYCEDDPQCEDVGADQLKISTDRGSVGWAAEYNGCCQNYPLEWTLVIARNGRVVRRIHPVRIVADWTFEQGDRFAAVFTDTPHGDLAPLCQLFDLRTGKQVAVWQPKHGRRAPQWAKPLAGNFER